MAGRSGAVVVSATAARLAQLAPPALAALQARREEKTSRIRAWAITANISPLILAGLSEELVSSRWLSVSAEGYSFAHDLIRSVVYDEIKPAERRMLTERAVLPYQELEPDNVRGRHFTWIGRGGRQKAQSLTVGRGSKTRDVSPSWRRRLPTTPPGHQPPYSPLRSEIEVAIALAGVCEVTGDRQRQRTTLDEALAGLASWETGHLLLQALLMSGRAASRTGNAPRRSPSSRRLWRWPESCRTGCARRTPFTIPATWQACRGNGRMPGFAIRKRCRSRGLFPTRRTKRALRGIAIAARFMGDLQELAAWLEQCLAV